MGLAPLPQGRKGSCAAPCARCRPADRDRGNAHRDKGVGRDDQFVARRQAQPCGIVEQTECRRIATRQRREQGDRFELAARHRSALPAISCGRQSLAMRSRTPLTKPDSFAASNASETSTYEEMAARAGVAARARRARRIARITGIDALERPAARQRRLDQRVDLGLARPRPFDDVGEERRLRLQASPARRSFQAETLELLDDTLRVLRRELDLIERLDRRKTRRGATVPDWRVMPAAAGVGAARSWRVRPARRRRPCRLRCAGRGPMPDPCSRPSGCRSRWQGRAATARSCRPRALSP